MTNPNASIRFRARASAGFSLVEVMIAMGIFAVGFVAVASLFPVSIVLQKQTVNQIESQLVARNASAMVRARKLTFTTFGDQTGAGTDLRGGAHNQPAGIITDADPLITHLTPFSSLTTNNISTRWTLGDRGYPTYEATANNRKYYWIPFLRKLKNPQSPTTAQPGDYQVVVFVLRRDPGKTYLKTAIGGGLVAYPADAADVPSVVSVPVTANSTTFTIGGGIDNDANNDNIPDRVRAGDWVADNRGYVYVVKAANKTTFTVEGGIPFSGGKTGSDPIAPANAVWFSPPPTVGDTSPCTRVLLLSDVVSFYNP